MNELIHELEMKWAALMQSVSGQTVKKSFHYERVEKVVEIYSSAGGKPR